MFSWALTFLIVALIAGALGFTGVAGVMTTIAKTFFVIFIILFFASIVFGKRPEI
jgi:uncharacterized membrane protein YtjA (UPF0391 family)